REAVPGGRRGGVERGVRRVDREGGRQHLGVELHSLHYEVLLEQCGNESVALAGNVIAARIDAKHVRKGERQPVGQLVAGAAVKGLDERLAVLVVPEADAGRLTLLDRAGGGWPLAEVVVQADGVRGQR